MEAHAEISGLSNAGGRRAHVAPRLARGGRVGEHGAQLAPLNSLALMPDRHVQGLSSRTIKKGRPRRITIMDAASLTCALSGILLKGCVRGEPIGRHNSALPTAWAEGRMTVGHASGRPVVGREHRAKGGREVGRTKKGDGERGFGFRRAVYKGLKSLQDNDELALGASLRSRTSRNRNLSKTRLWSWPLFKCNTTVLVLTCACHPCLFLVWCSKSAGSPG